METDRHALRADIARRLFRTDAGVALPDRMGLELELLPVERETGRVVPLEGEDGTKRLLAQVGLTFNWTVDPLGIHHAPCGCRVTFEPGGQIEISTPTAPTVDRAVDCLRAATDALATVGERWGIALEAVGFDPRTPLSHTRLQLDDPRYRAMDRHLARFGPAGARMMRQSCALQVNLDLGRDPFGRWQAANRIAPLLTALFANSARAEGQETGWRSWRAAQWRMLDPSRTGCVGPGHDPVREYLAFARAADPFLEATAWTEAGRPTAAWERHLSTLFPEVRPRGYLELRSIDAVPLEWVAAPLVVAAGLLYDPRSVARVRDALPFPDEADLGAAAREGLKDDIVRAMAAWAFECALEGAERLGAAFIGGAAFRTALDYYERFTAEGRDLSSPTASVGAQAG
ncbi:MAG: glutamate-cysteine ligase family protein [Gemmatimonadota bacterium]|nr:hypothetical protein [Gemmatimonadota bacterium]